MRNKATLANIIIDSDYLFGRIKDNSGTNDGTPVNEFVYGDIHQFFAKLITLAGITPNNLPDNETNGYQTIQALKEFATKNNYIQNISSVSGVLNVSAKIGLMQTNEFLVCKASVDLGAETQIKGTDGITIAITTIGTFKTDEYVRLIKTASTIVLVRISDSASLDLMVSELLFLKKTSQATENDGTSDLFATTPLTNKTVFARRVNGADSGGYLATPSQNGLLSAADKIIIDGLTNKVINKGWFSGINISVTTGALPTNGDVSSAVASVLGTNGSSVLVTMANTMANTDYYVEFEVESEGTLTSDIDCMTPIFKKISTSQFTFSIREVVGATQNLKVHFKVIQL